MSAGPCRRCGVARRLRTWAGCLGVLAGFSSAGPREGAVQAPQRDGALTLVGTSSVTGLVTTTDATPRPLRRAKVTLSSGLVTTPRAVLTDDNGAYVFTGLAPGNYTIVATRAGFITGAYGSTRPGSTQGVPVAVVAGQTTSGLDIRLARGAVVTGTVRSASGQPVPDFQVSVMPASGLTLEQIARQMTSTTDDRGIYRVFGLAAGDYVVMARPSNLSAVELRRVSADEVRRAQAAMTSSISATAPLAGASAPVPVATVAAPAATLTYAPVFHPGTADPAAATVVRLAAGEERAGVDLTTVIVPTARVAGTLVDVEGRPASNTMVNIQRVDGTQMLEPDLGRFSARTNAAGQFGITNVVPGRYRVVARSAPAPAARPDGPARQRVDDGTGDDDGERDDGRGRRILGPGGHRRGRPRCGWPRAALAAGHEGIRPNRLRRRRSASPCRGESIEGDDRERAGAGRACRPRQHDDVAGAHVNKGGRHLRDPGSGAE